MIHAITAFSEFRACIRAIRSRPNTSTSIIGRQNPPRISRRKTQPRCSCSILPPRLEQAFFGRSVHEEARRREVKKIRQHVRQVVSKLRNQLKEKKIDDHVSITCENPKELPSYTMHLRS